MITKFKFLISIPLSFFFISQATAALKIEKSFMPENNLWISSQTKSNNGMTEELFNQIIEKIEKVYAPIVSKNGGTLNIERNWEDGTVNAYASRRFGKWNVAMFGGLARHEAVTPDGFALVVCHELGHHLGGIPKMPGFFTSWATNEGQSDYYATLKCMRKVYIGDDNEKVMAGVNVPTEVVNQCQSQFSNRNEQFLCQRSAMAGYSLASLLKVLSNDANDPSFTNKDPNVVSQTKHKHPATQCRLDTYFAGALCAVSDTQDVSYSDEAAGVCYRSNGDAKGSRPLCWFKPKR